MIDAHGLTLAQWGHESLSTPRIAAFSTVEGIPMIFYDLVYQFEEQNEPMKLAKCRVGDRICPQFF